MPLVSSTPAALLAQSRGFQAISEAGGIGIAVTGMLIVFVALVVITLFVAKLPAILATLDPWLPEIEAHGPPAPAEQTPLEEERIVAAIGYALHQRRGER